MNIYVGNLSFDATDDDLREAFESFGTVDTANVIRDHYSGRSRGFGFVEMPESAEAEAAIAGLDGQEVAGRSVKVNEARPRPPRGDRRGGGGGGGGGGRRRRRRRPRQMVNHIFAR